MVGRQTKGRQKIPIRRIENQDDMYATFSKRRLGLYKKASELSTLCGVDIGVIIFSPTDNPFSFFHPSMESVVERYMNPNNPISDYTHLTEAHSRARIEYFNRRLDEVLEMKEKLKQQEKYLDEVDKTRPKGCWEEIAIENLDKDRMREWIALFKNICARARNRINELKNGATSTFHQQQVNVVSFSGPSILAPSNGLVGLSSYDPPGVMLGTVEGLFSSQYCSGTLQEQYQPDVNEAGQILAQNNPGHYYPFSGFPEQVDDPRGDGIGQVPSYCIFPGPTSQAQEPLPKEQNTGYDSSSFCYLPGTLQGPDFPNGGEDDGNEFFGGQYGGFPQQGHNPGDASENGGGGEGGSQEDK